MDEGDPPTGMSDFVQIKEESIVDGDIPNSSLCIKQENDELEDINQELHTSIDIKEELLEPDNSCETSGLRPCSVVLDRSEIDQYYCSESHQYRVTTSGAAANKVKLWTVPFKHEADDNVIWQSKSTEIINPGSTEKYTFSDLKCKVCKKTFYDKKSFKRHKKYHSLDRKFICTVCNQRYETKAKLKLHCRVSHVKIECNICNKKYSHYYLDKHIETMHLKKDYTCNFCLKICDTKSSIYKHIKNEHLLNNKIIPDLIKCEICRKSFGEKYSLQRHVKRIHVKEKNNECNICGRKFCLLKDLRQHINVVHMKKTPFSCEICNIKFKRRYHLKQHDDYVHNLSKDAQIECKKCSKIFSSVQTLKVHNQRLHLKLVRCHCEICNKPFFCMTDLKIHLSIQHHLEIIPKKIFTCNNCNKVYKCRKAYKSHLKKCINLYM